MLFKYRLKRRNISESPKMKQSHSIHDMSFIDPGSHMMPRAYVIKQKSGRNKSLAISMSNNIKNSKQRTHKEVPCKSMDFNTLSNFEKKQIQSKSNLEFSSVVFRPKKVRVNECV